MPDVILPPATKAINKFIYAPDGWNDAWISAKANSETTPAWITVIGDSIVQGVSSTDFMAKGFYEVMKANLKTRYTLLGDFYMWTHSSKWFVDQSGTFNGTPPWVINTTNTNYYDDIYGKGVYWTTNANANLATFTTPYACTDIDIFYLDHNSGTWKYSVDSGSLITVTVNNANFIKRIQLTGLANTTHTVQLGTQSADVVCLPVGCATYGNRTKGIGFANLGISGQKLQQGWASGGTIVADQPTQLQGNGAATTGFGFPTQPSLMILEYGINDCSAANVVATYIDNIRKMIQAARRGVSDCSIILLGCSNPDAVNSEVTSNNFSNSANWGQFLDAMARQAQSYNCAFVNIHAKWGETGVTKGFQTASSPHPNDAGHQDIASVLGSLI